MVIIDIVIINTLLSRLALDPVGMHCPVWDDAFVSSYRQDCREAANCRYKIYSQAKNQVSRPARVTRCTDLRQILHDQRAPGSIWLCNILPQSAQGVGMCPKYQKFPLFGKESPRMGKPIDRFLQFLRAFIRRTILH